MRWRFCPIVLRQNLAVRGNFLVYLGKPFLCRYNDDRNFFLIKRT